MHANQQGDAKYRLTMANGCVLHAVLKLLASTVWHVQFERNYNLSGVVSVFDYSDDEGIEGWPKMDGSMGIKITHIGEFSFDADEMTIEEQT